MTGRRIAFAALGAAALAAAGAIAWYAMFSHYTFYDDEGYFLVSLKLVANGQRLYDDVASGYGPFYYTVFVPLFELFGGVTHDAGRLTVIVIWIAGALVWARVIWRLTANVVLACVTGALVFKVMSTLVWEPMDPSSLLYLLLAWMALVAVRRGPDRLGLVGLGALLAVATLTKINVGGFAALAALFALVVAAPVSSRLRWVAAAVAFVAAPLVTLGRDLGDHHVRLYFVLVVASGLAVAAAAVPGSRGPSRRALLSGAAAALAAGALVLLVAILAFGSTPGGLYDGIITRALGQRDSFTVFTVPTLAPTTVLLLAVPAAVVLSRRGGLPGGAARGIVHLLAGVAIAIATLVPGFESSTFGAAEWGLPVAWLVVSLISPATADDGRLQFARTFITSMAVLESLYAYPVSGSQMSYASVQFVPVAALCIHDGLALIRANPMSTLVARAAMAVPVLLAVASAFFVLAKPLPGYRDDWRAGTPLPFDGATLLHLDPAVADRFVWAARTLAPCSTFVTYPGMGSLYLLTHRDPPTLFPQVWPITLERDRQLRVIAQLKASPRPCVIANEQLIDFWHLPAAPHIGPLAQLIRTRYRVVARRDKDVILEPARR